MRSMDLNVDVGEGGAQDGELMELASSANIACGGHAGDEGSMREAIDAALAHGVAIGAHPGYEDRENFGRRDLELAPGVVADLVSRQVERLCKLVARDGAALHHVKAHGALYNQADCDPELAAAVAAGVRRVSPAALLYVPPARALARAGQEAGLAIRLEGFADRRYRPDGRLVPRGEPGAVLEDAGAVGAQALTIAWERQVASLTGALISLPAETLCVHGDGPRAAVLLQTVRRVLEAAGFRICA